jgi:glycogen synthase
LFSRARGFLNPIEWEEPFGMVMIEAMALGCPVISFARGAAPELIVHRKTGFLVHDVKEMVRFIPRIDEIDRDVTRKHVEDNFSARVMAEKYVKIYKKVIEMAKEVPTRTFSSVTSHKLLAGSKAAIIKKTLPAQPTVAMEAEPKL